MLGYRLDFLSIFAVLVYASCEAICRRIMGDELSLTGQTSDLPAEGFLSFMYVSYFELLSCITISQCFLLTALCVYEDIVTNKHLISAASIRV